MINIKSDWINFHTSINILLVKTIVSWFGLVIWCALVSQCTTKPASATAPNTNESRLDTVGLSEEEISEGWLLLFNGKDASAWRGYNRDTLPGSWVIEDGHLVCRRWSVDHGDIVTKEQFDDFELSLEFMFYDSANSGVFHRVQEVPGEPMWVLAPEYQIIDNPAYISTFGDQFPSHGVGECYDLFEAERDYSNPLGEWNKLKIISLEDHIEYWLNGYRTVSFDIGSAEWVKRVAKSKFKPKQMTFGKVRLGHLGLQDHGQDIRFKNIKIRKINNQ